MNKTLKICLVLCLALGLVCSFGFSASAADYRGGTYRLAETPGPWPGSLTGSNGRDISFRFVDSDGSIRSAIFIQFDADANGSLTSIKYRLESRPTDALTVWTLSDGWVDDNYRYIEVAGSFVLDGDYALWFSSNSVRITGTLEDIFGNGDSLVTTAITWADLFVGFISSQPLVLLYALIPLVGLGVGLLVRSKRVN